MQYKLYDVVEMKKEHPCESRCKIFQIVRVGADIRIRCLGCGKYMMFPNVDFVKKVRRISATIPDSIYLEKNPK